MRKHRQICILFTWHIEMEYIFPFNAKCVLCQLRSPRKLEGFGLSSFACVNAISHAHLYITIRDNTRSTIGNAKQRAPSRVGYTLTNNEMRTFICKFCNHHHHTHG